NDFVLDISAFNHDKKFFLFVLLRFLFEYHSWYDVLYSLKSYQNYMVIDRLNKVKGWDSQRNYIEVDFSWIKTQMPYLMVKHLFASDNFKRAKELINDIDKANSDIQDKLDEFRRDATSSVEYVDFLKEEVRVLEGKFLNVKSEGNFKLLSKGFSTIRRRKGFELVFAHLRTWFFLLLLISVPLWVILYHPLGNGELWFLDVISTPLERGADLSNPTSVIEKNKVFDWGRVLFYIPLATLELLFFYFMRLFYGELKSIRAQLLQVDLRLNLCEFMHDYAETRSKSTSDDNKDSWKSFESLIFSPLQVSDDKIPAVLDGADAIAELAGKIIGRKTSS
ncbi:hypothetical protein, partial [Dickeya sp. CFBP 2040]|uniref:hypothetical protein n=1 Tax=Dickeya sp. CFBP 2040 TaxID=2718531 RepID=UPI0014456B24